VDAKSGVSGAGRDPKPELHFPETNESMTAYKVGVHQHNGEILQTARELAGRDVEILFVPHLIPMDRGILATIYAPLAAAKTTDELKALYSGFYAKERFVRVRTDDTIPTTKHVFDTNFCDIAVRGLGRTAVVIACIDNLIKGAAGQAVQNMNILFGLPESAGLL
jgi:N-acetyl-gamma-glutamyl-phosphate reductase